MSNNPKEHGEFWGRFFNYANNPTTLVGVTITTVTALLIIIFTIAEFAGAFHNPYVGIITFVILPAFFVLGLIIMPIGIALRHRKLIKSGATKAEMATYPRLDFNNPGLRKLGAVILILTGINAVILGTTSFMAVEHMDSTQFCGATCHTVMQPEYTAYQESPHSRVRCVECHIGPGASWFVKSKLDGLRQVWHNAMGTYHRPIETPLHNLRPARETCENCHWPLKHHGDKLRVFARYAEDETNTPAYYAMILKTGGGSLDTGKHGGIHWWHIYSDNRIRYLASDDRNQEIAWVELTTATGEVRVYARDHSSLPQEDAIKKAGVMDCIDCHNRPTHQFTPPGKAMDEVLTSYPALQQLPSYKTVAVKAIKGEYPTHTEGVASVKAALLEYYKTEHADFAKQNEALVMQGASEAANVYGRTVFPQMNTNWQTHPNNIGHPDVMGGSDEGFPGCFRCHNDEMFTADRKHVIPMDCETCHALLVNGDSELPNMETLLIQ